MRAVTPSYGGRSGCASLMRCGRVIGLAMLMTFAASTGVAQTPKEEALKAAFAFNFAKFTTWPPAKAPTDAVQICFEEQAIDSSAFENWRTKRIHDVPVVTRVVPSTFDGVSSCHLVFVGNRLDDELHTRLLQSARQYNILLVSDAADFARRGGHIGLVRDESRIRFQVNLAAVRLAGLVLSSQLLRVAEIIDA